MMSCTIESHPSVVIAAIEYNDILYATEAFIWRPVLNLKAGDQIVMQDLTLLEIVGFRPSLQFAMHVIIARKVEEIK